MGSSCRLLLVDAVWCGRAKVQKMMTKKVIKNRIALLYSVRG